MSNFELTKQEAEILSFHENKQLIEALEFLIEDRAFATGFLLTSILEYIATNKPEAELWAQVEKSSDTKRSEL